MRKPVRRLILVCVGEFLPFDLRAFSARLNRLQDFASVEVIESMPLPLDNQVENQLAYFAVVGNIIDQMQTQLAARGIDLGPEDSVVGFTSARISTSADDPEGEYFSYYSAVQTGRSFDERFAVASTALWKQKYEATAFRSVKQYAVYAIISYWLDRFVEGGISHAEFRYCVGDLSGDLDSIVFSVRKARLCASCARRVADAERPDLTAAGQKMLRFIRRPPITRVFEAVQRSSILSFMLMGVLFSLFTGALGDMVGHSLLASGLSAAIFIAVFVAVIVKEHFSPGDQLG